MGVSVCRRWTQEERDYVEDKWGLISPQKIAKDINRSYGAVRRYAENNRLGGCCYNNPLFYTTTEIGSILNVDQTTVIAWIKSKKLKAVKRVFGKNKTFLVNIDDFEIFKESYTPKNRKTWTTLQERQLLSLVNEGKTNKEIAIIMSRTESSVKRKRNRLYIER